MPKTAPRKNGARKDDRKVTSVKIRADLHNRARHYALDHSLSWGQLLDEALEDYLKKKGA